MLMHRVCRLREQAVGQQRGDASGGGQFGLHPILGSWPPRDSIVMPYLKLLHLIPSALIQNRN